MTAFHEVLFPIDIAFGSRGGPQRKTDVVTLGSGREERNQRWFHSRRRYNAGYGIKSLNSLSNVIAFFEERCGKLYGFRWRDRTDFKSCMPTAQLAPNDQDIGTGDGTTATFQLRKSYGSGIVPYHREITKPVAGSVRAAIDGTEVPAGGFSCDGTTGNLTFDPAHIPSLGSVISAGFEFDVPVRFDTDYLDIDLAAFEAGEIPELPIVEITI